MFKEKLKAYWIIFRSVCATLYYCGSTVIFSYLGKLDRNKSDEISRRWSQAILNIIQLKTELKNPHQVSFSNDKPTIIMVNHASLYDIPISFVTLPGSIRMLAKKELYKIPVFGQAMKKAEFLSINRFDREQAIKDLIIAKEKMNSGIMVWMAPEGTRSKDGTLGPFKKGGFITAIQAGATIIPVGIRGATNILPKKTLQFKTHQTAEVHVGMPIDASQYSLQQRDELMEKVRKEMLKLMDQA